MQPVGGRGRERDQLIKKMGKSVQENDPKPVAPHITRKQRNKKTGGWAFANNSQRLQQNQTMRFLQIFAKQ